MQNKDIKVGEDYAFMQYESRYGPNPVERVTVVKTGVEQTQGSYGRRTVKSGVLVKFLTGNRVGSTQVVKARQIKRTWAEQEPINASKAAAATASEQFKREQAERRAKAAMRLNARLLDAGVEGTYQSIYREHNVSALKAAGAATRPSDYRDDHDLFYARFDLDDWMNKGTVRESVVLALLGEGL